MNSIPESIRKQLTAGEREDIEDGARLFATLHPNDRTELEAFIEISLLALGFENGQRLN